MIRYCEYKAYTHCLDPTICIFMLLEYLFEHPHKSIYHLSDIYISKRGFTKRNISGQDFSSLRGHLSVGWIGCRGTPWDVPADRWPSVGPRQPVRACKGGVRIDVGVRRRGWEPTARFGMGDDSVSGHFGRSRATAGQSDRVALDIRQTQRGTPQGSQGSS